MRVTIDLNNWNALKLDDRSSSFFFLDMKLVTFSKFHEKKTSELWFLIQLENVVFEFDLG